MGMRSRRMRCLIRSGKKTKSLGWWGENCSDGLRLRIRMRGLALIRTWRLIRLFARWGNCWGNGDRLKQRKAKSEKRKAKSEKRKAKSEKRKAKSETRKDKSKERKAKSEKRKAKSEKRKAKSEKRKAKSEKRKAK